MRFETNKKFVSRRDVTWNIVRPRKNLMSHVRNLHMPQIIAYFLRIVNTCISHERRKIHVYIFRTRVYKNVTFYLFKKKHWIDFSVVSVISKYLILFRGREIYDLNCNKSNIQLEEALFKDIWLRFSKKHIHWQGSNLKYCRDNVHFLIF